MKKFPTLPPLVPHRNSSVYTQMMFKRIFLAQGWEMHGEFPNLPKAVAIISPHTSNIDAWYGFLALLGLNIKITIFGKHSLFKTPLKPILEWIGVIPVVRNSPQGHTQQIADIIASKEQIWVGMAPEGTRKEAEKFRSGFYHIADTAQIPIVMFAFDYQHIHYLVYVKCMHFPGLFTDFIGKPSLFLYGSLGLSNLHLTFNKLLT